MGCLSHFPEAQPKHTHTWFSPASTAIEPVQVNTNTFHVICGIQTTFVFDGCSVVPLHRGTKQQTRIENYIEYTYSQQEGTVVNLVRTRDGLLLEHVCVCLSLYHFNPVAVSPSVWLTLKSHFQVFIEMTS